MSDIVERLLQRPEIYLNKEAAAEIERLQRAAKAVCDHWAEFGPEHGFDETVELLYRALKDQQP